MNWGSLKAEIRDLGFEEDESINEYEDIVISAANRSIEEIALNALPILGVQTLKQDGKAGGLVRYDFLELTKEDGVSRFYSFAEELPVRMEDGTRFNDFDVEGRHVVVMKGSEVGSFDFYYNRVPTMITKDTSDQFEIELDRAIHSILPLLCCYYVWLDDDERKATMYFNRYEQLKAMIIGSNTRVVAEIRGGI